MKERERRNRLKMLKKLIRIKIQVLPTDTVGQWVDHRRDKPWTCFRILASVIFFICSVGLFLICYSGEALEGPISTGVCKNSTMLTQITTYKYKKYYAMYI